MTVEDEREFRTFCEKCSEEFAPRTHSEEQIVQTIAGARWRLERARALERELLTVQSEGRLNVSTELKRLAAYEKRVQRTLDRSVMLLEREQKSRRESQLQMLANLEVKRLQ